MSDSLVRFGVAMEASLLQDFDRVVSARGSTRSEAFRDLARAAVVRADLERGVQAVAALTLVYDHHVRDLTEKLTELQHELGEDVRATLHVHLDHDYCLEVVVMRGRSDQLRLLADRILGMRGVKHGDIEIITGLGEAAHAHHKKAPKKHGRHRTAKPKRGKRSTKG
jgi:CopG family nickel-responsive transcriptional regulator